MAEKTRGERLATIEQSVVDIREELLPAIKKSIDEIKGKQRCDVHEQKIINVCTSIKGIWAFLTGIGLLVIAQLINLFWRT